MNIIILSGRFGMGHIKCAETIKEIILLQKPDANVTVIDIIDWLYPKAGDAIYSCFGTVVRRFSRLFNSLYKLSGKNSCLPLKEMTVAKLKKLTETYRPDLVVADLPLGCQYYSMYRRETGDKTPLFVVITDITFHKDWLAPGADLYFVGDITTKEELTSRGVAPEKIHITGIPVSDRFNGAKEAAAGKKVLVMGGGLGLIPGGKRALEILNRLSGTDVTVLCGQNRRLRRLIAKKYPNIHPIGFTDRVPELLRDTSVLITKPGGITLFEAIKAETPLYIIAPTLAQELGNARFIEKHGIGRIARTEEDFTERDLLAFLGDEQTLTEMKANMRTLSAQMENGNPLAYFEGIA